MIILEWNLKKWDGWGGLDSPSSGLGPVVSLCEHVNEPSGSIKDGEFIN
jgi:hypothetical protein